MAETSLRSGMPRQLQIDAASDVQELSGRHPKRQRIIGGTVATAKNYPFSVYGGACGGSLVHADIVLSAAHCALNGPPKVVRVGGSKTTNGVERRIVGDGVIHPLYRKYDDAQHYDFVLFKLDTPISTHTPVILNGTTGTTNTNTTGTTTSSLRAASHNDDSSQQLLTAIGFGATTYDPIHGAGASSSTLQEVNVSLIEFEKCNRAYHGLIDDKSMFCAGAIGKDTCKGDSGGPILDANNPNIQVGVTSWGEGCGHGGVYARVSAVVDWIHDEICALSDVPPTSCSNNNNNGTQADLDNNNNNNDNDNDNDGIINDFNTFINVNVHEYDSNNIGSNNDNIVDDVNDLDNVGLNNDNILDANTENEYNDNTIINATTTTANLEWGNSIRIDIYFDAYPWQNAWAFYNDDTDEELHTESFGTIEESGLESTTFTNLEDGRYVFLLLDNFADGFEEGGKVEVYQVYPPQPQPAQEGGVQPRQPAEVLIWSHDNKFENGVGAAFLSRKGEPITHEVDGRRARQ